jgi:uncharacterized protein YerC
MVYVSKKPVKREVLVRISELLIAHVAHIRTRMHAEKFLNEILTESEKIMLAKRFAIVVMLKKKQSYTTIKKILKVSHTTIAKTNRELEQGKFDFIISQLQKLSPPKVIAVRKRQKKESFWDVLECMIQFGMPPMGKGRWRFLDELDRKEGIRKKRKMWSKY